jgi:peptidoglycan/xylan/chitin deacetylase (PgdA/CDA1 family)
MRVEINILKRCFPSILVSTEEGVHLTFDDGPHPVATPKVLQILKSRNLKASFFLLGQNAQKYPDLVSQIHADGHLIGNHSFTHTNLLFKNKSFVRTEVLQTKQKLEELIGTHSHYFRPPYGYFDFSTLTVLRELKLSCVLWNIDSKDYKYTSHVNISNRVIRKTKNGSIILLHDNIETSTMIAEYLPKMLDVLLQQDFIFKTLPI